MNPMGTAELLDLWEQGLSRTALERSLILVSAARPDLTPGDVSELCIGDRDTELLLLRRQLFGERLVNTSVCPQCTERTEWESSVEDLLVDPANSGKTGREFDLSVDDFQLRFRLPNSSDLARIDPRQEPRSAVAGLLEGCVRHARSDGESCTADGLPAHVVEALGRRIEELDPQAEINIHLTCPNCAHEWQVLFDVGLFLWAEISDWAERMLLAVHDLAAAYRWRERDILALTPIRRRLYLEMVR
jgi:hypothetical protein